MSILAQIRAAGGKPYLKPDGEIGVSKLPPELIDEARASKEQIKASLNAEGLYGVDYQDHPLWVWVDDFYAALGRMSPGESVAGLKQIVLDFDERLHVSTEDGIAWFRGQVERFGALLMEACSLRGEELRQELKRVFGVDGTMDVGELY